MIGQNNQAGKSILKTDFKENATLSANLKLAVKILLKTMDATTPSPERIELSEVKKIEDGTCNICYSILLYLVSMYVPLCTRYLLGNTNS